MSEIYNLYDEYDDVTRIQFGRLGWAGHVMIK